MGVSGIKLLTKQLPTVEDLKMWMFYEASLFSIIPVSTNQTTQTLQTRLKLWRTKLERTVLCVEEYTHTIIPLSQQMLIPLTNVTFNCSLKLEYKGFTTWHYYVFKECALDQKKNILLCSPEYVANVSICCQLLKSVSQNESDYCIYGIILKKNSEWKHFLCFHNPDNTIRWSLNNTLQ